MGGPTVPFWAAASLANLMSSLVWQRERGPQPAASVVSVDNIGTQGPPQKRQP